IESEPLNDYILLTGYSDKHILAKLMAKKQHQNQPRYITCNWQRLDRETLSLAFENRKDTTLILRDAERLSKDQVIFLMEGLEKTSYKIILTSKINSKALQNFPCNKLLEIYNFKHFHIPNLSERKEDISGIIDLITQKEEFKELSLSKEE